MNNISINNNFYLNSHFQILKGVILGKKVVLFFGISIIINTLRRDRLKIEQ